MSLSSQNNNKHQLRVERSKAKILAAATELLVERGLSGFTIDAIVERTGVAKTTVYRHWRSRDQLLTDTVLYHFQTGAQALPDTGSLRGDLLAFVMSGLRAMERGGSQQRQLRTLPGIIDAANRNPELADLCVQTLKLTLNTLRPMFERACERGEVSPNRDLDAMTHLVLGALFIHQALDFDTNEAYVTEVVDLVLRGALVDDD